MWAKDNSLIRDMIYTYAQKSPSFSCKRAPENEGLFCAYVRKTTHWDVTRHIHGLVNSVHNNSRPDFWEFLSTVSKNSQQLARSLDVLFVLCTYAQKSPSFSGALLRIWGALLRICTQRNSQKLAHFLHVLCVFATEPYICAKETFIFAKETKKMTTPLTFENITFAWRMRTSHLSAVEYKEPTVDGKLAKEPYTFAKDPCTFAKEH